jgi:hypothetical protein
MSLIETELRVSDDGALFVVRTDDAGYREALRELAYDLMGGEFTRRFPADTPDLAGIFSRFEQRIDDVLEQLTDRRPAPWRHALAALARRLDDARVDWFVCGSAALAIRGIEVAPHDIDIVTTDHAAVRDALEDALIEPPLHDAGRDWIAEWFGRAWLGIRVEWVAGVYPEIDSRPIPNEFGPTAASRLERIEWNGRALLLSPLDLQWEVSRQRGLDDRVGAIDRYQRARGS